MINILSVFNLGNYSRNKATDLVGTSLSSLSRKEYKNLLVVAEIYRQQLWMYENKAIRIEDRIVSINQPHIRPIVRGKAGASVEFGAKISASCVEFFVFIFRQKSVSRFFN